MSTPIDQRIAAAAKACAQQMGIDTESGEAERIIAIAMAEVVQQGQKQLLQNQGHENEIYLRAAEIEIEQLRAQLTAREAEVARLRTACEKAMIAITGRCDQGDEPTENEKEAYAALLAALTPPPAERKE